MKSNPFPKDLDLYPVRPKYCKVGDRNDLFEISFERCQKPMDIGKFEELSKALSNHLEPPKDPATYLNGIAKCITERIPVPHYEIDIPLSLLDTWNISKFTRTTSILHGFNCFGKLDGINTPYLYLAMDYTSFGFHIEELR